MISQFVFLKFANTHHHGIESVFWIKLIHLLLEPMLVVVLELPIYYGRLGETCGDEALPSDRIDASVLPQNVGCGNWRCSCRLCLLLFDIQIAGPIHLIQLADHFAAGHRKLVVSL